MTEGVSLSQTPMRDWTQGRELCVSRPNPLTSVGTGLSQKTQPELARENNLQRRRNKEPQLREQVLARDLCMSRCKSVASEGAGLSHRRQQDWVQARELCGNKPKAGISVAKGLSQLLPLE